MPDHVLHCLPECQATARTTFGFWSSDAFPTAATPLTTVERGALHELRRRFEIAAVHLADALAVNQLGFAYDCLQRVIVDTDGLALAAATRLGARR